MPDNKIDKAYELFKSGMSLAEIAIELEVSAGTVRSWKSRYKWDGDPGTQRTAKRRSAKKKEAQHDATEEKKAVENMLQPLFDNKNLTDQQKLFCLYFVKSFNAAQSYMKAYPGVAYSTAQPRGSRLLGNPKIRLEIERLKKERMTQQYLEAPDIFQKYMDIAFSDIGDYFVWGREWQPYLDKGKPVVIQGLDGQPTISGRDVNVVKLREADSVDTSLVTEIKHGKDSFSIKLLDKQKALDWLAEHIGMATDEQKARIELIKTQTDKIKGTGNDIEDLDDIRGTVYGDEE